MSCPLQAVPAAFEVRPAADDSSADDDEEEEGGQPLTLVEQHKAKMGKPKTRKEREREEIREEEEKAGKLQKVCGSLI